MKGKGGKVVLVINVKKYVIELLKTSFPQLRNLTINENIIK
jgi:hypothetical protein